MADQWYSDNKLVTSFGEALANAGVLNDSDDFKMFLKSPMRYNDAFNAWSEAGYPTDDSEDGWDDFLEALPDEDETEDEDEEE